MDYLSAQYSPDARESGSEQIREGAQMNNMPSGMFLF